MVKKRASKAKRKAAKGVAKRKGARKKSKSKAAKRKVTKVSKKKKTPPGYTRNRDGAVLVPSQSQQIDTVVETGKLVAGIKGAKKEVQHVIGELKDFDGYTVSEVSLEVSFTADGKFLGVGVGGATSIGLKLVPEDGEDS